jgi:hypothetical protein
MIPRRRSILPIAILLFSFGVPGSQTLPMLPPLR